MAGAATNEAARIRKLMLENLFAVFNVRDPEQRLEAIVRNYTEDVAFQVMQSIRLDLGYGSWVHPRARSA